MNALLTRCNRLFLWVAVAIVLVSCGRQQPDNSPTPQTGLDKSLVSQKTQADEAAPRATGVQTETLPRTPPAETAPRVADAQPEKPPQAAEAKSERPQSAETVHDAWVPDYDSKNPSVLHIANAQFRTTKKEVKSTDAAFAAIQEVGDLAWDSGTGDIFISSGKSVVLPEANLMNLADRDISDQLQDKQLIHTNERLPNTHVLIRTMSGNYALLHIGAVHNRRLQVFWIYQPNGSARFSEAALAALAAAGRLPVATISVLTDLSSPEGKLLDMSKAAILPSPAKIAGPSESQEDALRAIRQVADLAYCNGGLIAGSEKMAFVGRGQLADFAGINAAEDVRRRRRVWLAGSNIDPGCVFVVMMRDGKYALCRVMAKQGSTISIHWVMQQSGKPMFPVLPPDPPLKATSTLFDKLPKDPTARLQRLVSISPPGESDAHTDRTPVLAEIQRALNAGADLEAYQEPLGYNALHLAASSGATDAAELLLGTGAKVDSRCRGGATALHIAAYMNRYDVCKLLLRHGADPQAKSASGETPLAAALQRSPALQSFTGKDRVVSLLTESGGGPQSLHVAALAGDASQIKAILAKGVNINQRDSQSKTPLYIAAEQGKADAVALLLDAKGDASIQAPQGQYAWTPLIAAADKGHAEVVQLLLTKATSITAEEKQRSLYWAVLKQHVKVCQILVEHGAPYRDKAGGDGASSILEMAWFSPNPEIRALFRTRGEQMPLWAASQHGDTKTVQTLLAVSGVNPNERSPYGLASLHLAVQGGHLDLVPLLLDKGANINLPTTLTKDTALHLAVGADNLAAVKLLVAGHPNINALAMGGRSPLYCAAVLRTNAPIVRTLLDAGAEVALLPDGVRESGKTRLSELTRDKQIQKILQKYEQSSERK